LKKCFRCILDGLLFTSLLFLKEGINNQKKQITDLSSILHTSFQFKKGQDELNNFIDFIIRQLNANLNPSQKNDLKESLNGKNI